MCNKDEQEHIAKAPNEASETDTNMETTHEHDQSFFPESRLHPAGMFFSFIKTIKDTILGLGIGSVAIFAQSPLIGIIFVIVIAISLISYSVLSWLRYTYRIEEGELRIEQGVLIRKKRFISLNRIHKIDLTANVVHRIFKLVKVQIDTASSGSGAEVSLSAVQLKDAHILRNVLKQENQKEETTEDTVANNPVKAESPNPKRKISWKQLFIAGSTSGSAGVILLAILVLFSQTEQFIPDNVYGQAFQWIITLSIVFIIGLSGLILILIWFAGIAGTMIKYGNFIIEKREKELFIKRGLLETKELTIPFDRIQAIQVDQSLIRQPFKYVQISAIVAGGSFDSNESYPVLFPLMRKNEVNDFLEEFVPGYKGILANVSPLGKKGLKYYLFSAIIFFVIALFPVGYFFPTFSWIPGIFIMLGFVYGYYSFKESGYHLYDDKLIFQYRGIWNKTTVMTFHRRIQAMEKSQHKLQQLEDLASVKISLIGSSGVGNHYQLRHVKKEAADLMGDWYSYRKRKENNPLMK